MHIWTHTLAHARKHTNMNWFTFDAWNNQHPRRNHNNNNKGKQTSIEHWAREIAYFWLLLSAFGYRFLFFPHHRRRRRLLLFLVLVSEKEISIGFLFEKRLWCSAKKRTIVFCFLFHHFFSRLQVKISK